MSAVARGALSGAALIVPISVAAELLDQAVDDFDDSAWLYVAMFAILATYTFAGAVAGRAAARARGLHGALAALGAFVAWLVVRVTVPLVQGDDIGFGLRSVFGNALLAAAFGILGAAFARDNGSGGESARRPRTGAVPKGTGDPSEERPDSAGQGAG